MNEAQICTQLVDAATNVFETMCFSCVLGTTPSPLDLHSTPLGAAVQFTGTWNGRMELWASPEMAHSLAAAFEGEPCDCAPDEEPAGHVDQDLGLVLQELANMVCGSLLTDLYPDGEFYLASSVPSEMTFEEEGATSCGQQLELDEGQVWVSFSIR